MKEENYMSRTTPEEIGTRQFAALSATITQLLGKDFDRLNPRMVQRRMDSHEKLADKLHAIFEPDAEDWINAYRSLYQACGKIFDYDSKLRKIIRCDFRSGWWPVLVQPEISQDILWVCNVSMGLHIDNSIKEDVERALASQQTARVTWVRAERNVKTPGPDDSAKCISLLEWLVLASILNSLTQERLDDIAVNGTMMKANGGVVRAYYNQYCSKPLRIETWDPKICRAILRERFDRPAEI